jgi:hypothetical protein
MTQMPERWGMIDLEMQNVCSPPIIAGSLASEPNCSGGWFEQTMTRETKGPAQGQTWRHWPVGVSSRPTPSLSSPKPHPCPGELRYQEGQQARLADSPRCN